MIMMIPHVKSNCSVKSGCNHKLNKNLGIPRIARPGLSRRAPPRRTAGAPLSWAPVRLPCARLPSLRPGNRPAQEPEAREPRQPIAATHPTLVLQ
jgi:hypothetical protein